MNEQSPALKRPAGWEIALLLTAVIIALALGFSNLAKPGLWHDELVHVFVAKNIAAHAWPTLPSGVFYPSSLAYNYLLGGVVALFGDDAFTVRAPSVLLSGLNIILLFLLLRPLLGTPTALVAAFALALSPWSLAWARQARMYTLQTTAYLLFLHASYRFIQSNTSRSIVLNLFMIVFVYAIGILSSYHSILFLGASGAFVLIILCIQCLNGNKIHINTSVCVGYIMICIVLGTLTLVALYFNPNPADQSAIFETGLGGKLPDPQRLVRWYYLRWTKDNLSLGFLLLAFLGTAWMIIKERPNGLYVALSFWAPVLILTFLIGYRRERFMFFAFPCYAALFSYAVVQMVAFLFRFRNSTLHMALSVLFVVFGLRCTLSAVKLIGDSLNIAQGANTTLAVKHQQWRTPCEYVKQHRVSEAILTTMALPVLYYIGHVDNWFPNRYTWWEGQESGLKGLASLDELQAFLQEHPKGFFLADKERFEKWRHHRDLPDLEQEVAWVEQHMTRIEEASTEDVTLFAWNFAP